MYATMLKNQRVTFVTDVAQAEKYSPFIAHYNCKSDKYVVYNKSNPEGQQIVAAGLSKEEAEACVMFKANQWIYNNLQTKFDI